MTKRKKSAVYFNNLIDSVHTLNQWQCNWSRTMEQDRDQVIGVWFQIYFLPRRIWITMLTKGGPSSVCRAVTILRTAHWLSDTILRAAHWLSDTILRAAHWLSDTILRTAHWISDTILRAAHWLSDATLKTSHWLSDTILRTAHWLSDTILRTSHWLSDAVRTRWSYCILVYCQQSLPPLLSDWTQVFILRWL